MARYIQTSDARLLARLGEHRAEYATSLVGRWRTARGTFDVVMSEQWLFRGDGILTVISHNRLGTACEKYRWESAGPFRVRIGVPADEDCPDGTWSDVTYEFATVEHDAGMEVVLRETGEDGFWLSDAPLRREL